MSWEVGCCMQLLGKGAGKGTGQGLGVKAFGLWFRMALEGVRGGVLEVSPVLVELFVDFRSEGRACEKLVQTGTDFSRLGIAGAIYLVDCGAPGFGICGLVCVEEVGAIRAQWTIRRER